MTRSVVLERPRRPPRGWLLPGVALVLSAPLCRLAPQRIRWVLRTVRRGARPATENQARAARSTVVGRSLTCAGPACLRRSIATALLCRLHGTWPEWCTGVRLEPFMAHAWVQVDGRMVDEPMPAGYFTVTMSVPPI